MNKQKFCWSPQPLAGLVHRYPNEPTAAIAADLGCSVTSAYNKAHQLGLKKTAEYLAGPLSHRLTGTVGAETRFKPGQVPHNKGRTYNPGGRSAGTRFQTGNKPVGWRPIGSLRVNKDGCLERKVADPGSWLPVHRLVWEAENGPVPDGHAVVFLPGRRTTDLASITIDAVECISRSELMTRNSIHRYPAPLKHAIKLLAKAKRHIDGHQQY